MKSIFDFYQRKQNHQKISMVTCYDYTSAKIVEGTNVDCILVGDSLAMTMHGFDTTLNASVSMMALHTAAVARGLKNKWIVGDLPFLSYRKALTKNMEAIEKIMKAGAHSVKLEGVDGQEKLIRHIVESGVPVMGHLGLTPQSVFQLGGFKVQGKDAKAQELILDQAKRLEDAGCFSVVLECVPNNLAKKITEQLHIPTIGIGAGPDTDGQVLVWQDLLGMNDGFRPKFVRQYWNGLQQIQSALNQYHSDVQSQAFPSPGESYGSSK